MRIAFVTQYDARDRSAISGSAHQILEMVQATGAEVEVVGPVMSRWRFVAMRAASLPARLAGRGTAWPKHPFLLRSYARKVDDAVRRLEPDLVFSPGTNVLAYSSFLRPTVFWSDAPFAAMADYYPWPQYQRLTRRSRAHGMEADTRTLRHAAAAIYRSEWARRRAIDLHGAEPARVHVVPLPGNVYGSATLEECTDAAQERLRSPWRILFNGVDWRRKGGDRAVAIVNELVALGQPCELDIVGVQPPARALTQARFPLRAHPRQDLNDPGDRQLLLHFTAQATFVLVPSIAENFGFVYCEALDADEPPALTARRMMEAGRPERYLPMAAACWHEWQTRFAPAVIVPRLAAILEGALGKNHGPLTHGRNRISGGAAPCAGWK
jgi:glycosyltransferase involved in cell wall biosynthesis